LEITEDKLIAACLAGNSQAQHYLYNKYKVMLFRVCLRYARDKSEAEDILQDGFIKIFKDLRQYSGKGALGGWMRKVMVNAALQYLRKWKDSFSSIDIDTMTEDFSTPEAVYATLGLKELTVMIQHLPVGYRTVFNLYVIEGFGHKEIATMLDIKENTSKSQLFKAKAMLRSMLEKQLMTNRNG